MAKFNPPILSATIPAQKLSGNQMSFNIPITHNSSVIPQEVLYFIIKIFTLSGEECEIVALQRDTDEHEEWSNIINDSKNVSSNKLNIGSYYKLQIAYSDEKNPDNAIENSNNLIFSTEAVFKLSTDGQCTIYDFADNNLSSDGTILNCYLFRTAYRPQDKTEAPYLLQYKVDTPHGQFTSDILPYKWNNRYILPFLPLNTSAYSFEANVYTVNNLNEQFQRINNISCSLAKGQIGVGYAPQFKTGSIKFTPKNKAILWYRRFNPCDTFYSYMGMITQSYQDYTAPCNADDIFVEVAVNADGTEKRGYFGSIYQQPSNLLQFEDMFLYDGDKQLCLKFDPKITSFKTTLLESKIDTVGGKYPIFVRNGHTNYKEFSISATISYLGDDSQLFMNDQELFGKRLWNLERNSTNDEEAYLFPVSRSNNLTMQNTAVEFKFRSAVLEWLNNGKVKLFKSPTEGVMLIKLMNVSLTPNETLGRMIYSFSATAYEVADVNRDNLIKYGILKVDPMDGEVLL